MGLIDCPDCKGTVSDIAPACPHCGRPFEQENSTEEKVAGETDGSRENSDAINNEDEKPVPPIIEDAEAERRSYKGWVIGCLGVLLLFGAIGISAVWITYEWIAYDYNKKGEESRLMDQYDIQVDESSITITEKEGMSYVTGVAHNYSDQDYEQVEIVIGLYDAQGILIGQTLDYTNYLGANRVWNFQAPAPVTNATSAKIDGVIAR